MFIADEIQSAMGRAGRWYAIEDEGVVPDLVTTAKSIGGGLPISAVTGRAEIMDAVHAGGLGGTYGGNPVAAAASLAVLDKIEREDLLGSLARDRRRRSWRGFAAMRRALRRRSATSAAAGRCARSSSSPTAATKEPLGADAMNAIARRMPRAGRDRADGRDLRQRVRLLPPITIDEALLEDGLGVLDDAVGAAAGVDRARSRQRLLPSRR